MSTKDNGGPAFPCDIFTGKTHTISDGMSLRDHFAGEAMKPLLQAALSLDDEALINEAVGAVAPSAYLMADAMLKARKQ